MSTYWTYSRSLFANNNMTTITTNPNTFAIFTKHKLIVNIFKQFTIPFFMCFFNICYTFKKKCYSIKTFFFCYFCK